MSEHDEHIKEALVEEMHKEEERLFKKKKKPIIERAPLRDVLKMLLPFAGMLISAIEFVSLPQVHPSPAQYKAGIWISALIVCACVYAAFFVLSLFIRPLREKVAHFSYLVFAFFLFFTLLDYLTLRTGTLQLPFIPSPDRIVKSLVIHADEILNDALASLATLFSGLAIGISMGVLSGVLCGCVRLVDYWVSPLLKIVGPVPALIWMPLFFVLFHSSRAAALAAVFLASWFPLTLMISSAVKNTDVGLIERAQTLGASKIYVILHVMLPNAIPGIANALFMALSHSFGAMAITELLGAQAGLMYRVIMSRGIADYGTTFAVIGVMIVIFATLTAIMFAFRNWLLRWQKGLAKW